MLISGSFVTIISLVKGSRMAADNNNNPRERIPGTRSRFRFPSSDSGYAFLGPAIIVVLVVLVGLYTLGDWLGDTEGARTGRSAQPPAVQPGPAPQSPSNR